MVNAELVDLIYKKTKINKEDIQDVLRLLPEAMAEVFINSNIEPQKALNLGPATVFWNPKGTFGAQVRMKLPNAFKKHITYLKQNSKLPLAQTLNTLTHPVNKARIQHKKQS